MLFMPDDRIRYIGRRFTDLHGKVGVVKAKVDGSPKLSTEFEGEGYLMSPSSIVLDRKGNPAVVRETHVPAKVAPVAVKVSSEQSKGQAKEPEVIIRRGRREEL